MVPYHVTYSDYTTPFSALSTIFIAIVMKGQHSLQMLAPLKKDANIINMKSLLY